MLSDPIQITYNAVPINLARTTILQNPVGAVYQSTDGLFKLTITHQPTQKGQRMRVRVRLDRTAVVTDSLDNSNDFKTITDEHIIDRPALGFSMVDVERLVACSNGLMTNATVDKLYGGES